MQADHVYQCLQRFPPCARRAFNLSLYPFPKIGTRHVQKGYPASISRVRPISALCTWYPNACLSDLLYIQKVSRLITPSPMPD